MKKCVNLLVLFLCYLWSIPSFSQDMFDKSLDDLEKVNNMLADAATSFLKYPYSHSNTMIVFERIKEINKMYKDLQSNQYQVLSKWDNYKVRSFYDKVNKWQKNADAFEELLRTIAGYGSGGDRRSYNGNFVRSSF